MAKRNLVTVMAAFGGLFVILGGILGLLLSFAPSRFGGQFEGALGAFALGAIAVVFGIVILVSSGYTHYRGVDHSTTGGFILVVLGIVTWVVAGQWVLVQLGAFLTLVAGIILVAQLALAEPGVVTAPAS